MFGHNITPRYTKGAVSGVKEWDATNSTFPDGLAAFAKNTGWKFQMHNRMWSDNNIYAKENGGKYGFIVEPLPDDGPADQGESGLAIPTDQLLWDDLISNKTEHGVPMAVYEQDWMYNEWEGECALLSLFPHGGLRESGIEPGVICTSLWAANGRSIATNTSRGSTALHCAP